MCGDGVLSIGEECDDGNTNNGDGCSSQCDIESSCGNGVCEPEENSVNCPNDCQICFYQEINGCLKCPDIDFDGDVDNDDYNLIVQFDGVCEGMEEYNPAYNLDGDDCIDVYSDGDVCILPFISLELSAIPMCCSCGNGIVEPFFGEQCDYGNDDNVCDGCTACQIDISECCEGCCFGGYCCGDGMCGGPGECDVCEGEENDCPISVCIVS